MQSDSTPASGMALIPALAAALFFAAALVIWWSLDHSYPFWDGAAHVKDSMVYAQLIRHAHIFQPAWIKQFLTVNFDYPLTIHAINGLVKVVLGFGRNSDMAALLLYLIILMGSLYWLALVLLKDRLAGALTIVFCCSYPLVATLTHVPLLDLGYLAFTALALLGICTYHKKPDWKNAVLLGLTLAFGATSKQIAVLFLIVPCLILLASAVKRKSWTEVKQLTLAALFPALGLLLWMVPNHKALAAWRDYYKDDPTLKGGAFNAFIDHAWHYSAGLLSMLSPGLTIFVIVAAIYLLRRAHDRWSALLLPSTSAICGLLLLSCVALNRPEERYVIPVSIAASLISAAATAQWYRAKGALKAGAVCVILFAFIQFILLNYTPYPIFMAESGVQTIYKIAGHAVGQELVEPRPSPTPPGDKWGQEWLVAEIQKVEHGKKTTLNIMPSTPDLSVHTIDLVCIAAGTQIEPSTFRQFTLHGDIVRYDEQALKYYNWYLLKTGYQGSPLADEQSQNNYSKILDYVQSPANYLPVGERDLPDGGKLKLYHRAN